MSKSKKDKKKKKKLKNKRKQEKVLLKRPSVSSCGQGADIDELMCMVESYNGVLSAFSFKPSYSPLLQLEVTIAADDLYSSILLYLLLTCKPYERTIANVVEMLDMDVIEESNAYKSPLDMLFRELETGEIWSNNRCKFKQRYIPETNHPAVVRYNSYRAQPARIRALSKKNVENMLKRTFLVLSGDNFQGKERL